MEVRPATPADIEAIIDVHLASFQGFFLTVLGRRFLRELYAAFLRSPSGVTLVAVEGERLCGFVSGTTAPEAFFRSLLRARWWRFVVAALPALLRNPLPVARKLLSAVGYRGEAPATVADAALLSSIAVAPEQAGKGAGSVLVEGFCRAAAAHGKSCVYLTTDRDNNEPINRFYLRLGFQLESSFEKERGRWMNRYVKSQPLQAAAARS